MNLSGGMYFVSLLYLLVMASPVVLLLYFLYKMNVNLKEISNRLEKIENKIDR